MSASVPATAWGVAWPEAQVALAAEAARVVTLLRSGVDPSVPAVGDWSLGEVAMHLSQAWILVPGLAREDLSEVYAVVAGEGPSPLADVWDLGAFSQAGVKADPERDPAVLAGRIEERSAAFLAWCAGHDPGERRAWVVEGTTVDLCTLTGQLLNETVMHGGDIARAAGRPWPVSAATARLVIQGFLLPSFDALGPTAMVDQEAAAGVRATYEVRVRGGARARFAFDDGSVTVSPASTGRVDCHISADPAALLAVMWGRRSQWGAIARGQLVAWGRKPWLGLRLRSMLRNP